MNETTALSPRSIRANPNTTSPPRKSRIRLAVPCLTLLSLMQSHSWASSCSVMPDSFLPESTEQLKNFQSQVFHGTEGKPLGDIEPTSWNSEFSRIEELSTFSETKEAINLPRFSSTLALEEASAGRLARAMGSVSRVGERAAEALGPIGDIAAVGLWGYGIADAFSRESATTFDKAASILAIVPIVGDIMGSIQEPIDRAIIDQRIRAFESGQFYHYAQLNDAQKRDEDNKVSVHNRYLEFLGELNALSKVIMDDEIAKAYAEYRKAFLAQEAFLIKAFGRMDQEYFKSIIGHLSLSGYEFGHAEGVCAYYQDALTRGLNNARKPDVIKSLSHELLKCQRDILIGSLSGLAAWIRSPSFSQTFKQSQQQTLNAKINMVNQAKTNLDRIRTLALDDIKINSQNRIQRLLNQPSIKNKLSTFYKTIKAFAVDEWAQQYRRDGKYVKEVNPERGYLVVQEWEETGEICGFAFEGCMPRKEWVSYTHWFHDSHDATLSSVKAQINVNDIKLNAEAYQQERIHEGWTKEALSQELLPYVNAYLQANRWIAQGHAKKSLAEAALRSGNLSELSSLPVYANLKQGAPYIWNQLQRRSQRYLGASQIAALLAEDILSQGKLLIARQANATQKKEPEASLGHFTRWVYYQGLQGDYLGVNHSYPTATDALFNSSFRKGLTTLQAKGSERLAHLNQIASDQTYARVYQSLPRLTRNVDLEQTPAYQQLTAFSKLGFLTQNFVLASIKVNVCSNYSIQPISNALYDLADDNELQQLQWSPIIEDIIYTSDEIDHLINKASKWVYRYGGCQS